MRTIGKGTVAAVNEPSQSLPGQDPTDRPDYELASDTSADRVHAVVTAVRRAVQAGEVERREAVVMLSDRLAPVLADDPDVADITVREEIVVELNPVFAAAGMEALTPYEW